MSERDSDAPPDESWNDDAPKSDPAPPADGIRRIDTMLGSHLPGLIEKEVLEKATAAQRAATQEPAAQPAAPVEQTTLRMDSIEESPSKWKSPLQVGPDWLVALKSIPTKWIVIGAGGVAVGVLLTLSARGCGGDRRVDDLTARVALLEKTVGVSVDGGVVASAIATGSPNTANDASAPIEIGSGEPAAATNDACASARATAFSAWQDAVGKAKQLAGPAEMQCKNILTSQHKRTCMATATVDVRLAQAARDTTMKGGAAAKNAVKNVRDDGRNSAIATAKAASQAAFAACPDDSEL
jgi:hypothetical protein